MVSFLLSLVNPQDFNVAHLLFQFQWHPFTRLFILVLCYHCSYLFVFSTWTRCTNHSLLLAQNFVNFCFIRTLLKTLALHLSDRFLEYSRYYIVHEGVHLLFKSFDHVDYSTRLRLLTRK